jgi:hypothetical protein
MDFFHWHLIICYKIYLLQYIYFVWISKAHYHQSHPQTNQPLIPKKKIQVQQTKIEWVTLINCLQIKTHPNKAIKFLTLTFYLMILEKNREDIVLSIFRPIHK